jgi:hypothetical protein
MAASRTHSSGACRPAGWSALAVEWLRRTVRPSNLRIAQPEGFAVPAMREPIADLAGHMTRQPQSSVRFAIRDRGDMPSAPFEGVSMKPDPDCISGSPSVRRSGCVRVRLAGANRRLSGLAHLLRSPLWTWT